MLFRSDRPQGRQARHHSYSLDDGIATLTLNNGKVNAFSHELIAAFNQALGQAEQAAAVVIVTGQPGILSGGYYLKVMMSGPQAAIDLVAAGSTLARRMLSHPQPIIVACPGHAVAKGAFVLLSADYFPKVQEHTNKLAVIRSCHTDSHANGSALVAMNTGKTFIGRPSLGS